MKDAQEDRHKGLIPQRLALSNQSADQEKINKTNLSGFDKVTVSCCILNNQLRQLRLKVKCTSTAQAAHAAGTAGIRVEAGNKVYISPLKHWFRRNKNLIFFW